MTRQAGGAGRTRSFNVWSQQTGNCLLDASVGIKMYCFFLLNFVSVAAFCKCQQLISGYSLLSILHNSETPSSCIQSTIEGNPIIAFRSFTMFQLVNFAFLNVGMNLFDVGTDFSLFLSLLEEGHLNWALLTFSWMWTSFFAHFVLFLAKVKCITLKLRTKIMLKWNRWLGPSGTEVVGSTTASGSSSESSTKKLASTFPLSFPCITSGKPSSCSG